MARSSAFGAAAEVSRARRLLASCRVVLLDMNSTFMFGEDRLGPEEDFGATYQASGGRPLAPDDVRAIILACAQRLNQMYSDQNRIDDFPSVLEVLSEIPEAADLPVEECRRLATVLARHERGHVSAEYADAIHCLARTHRLGLITNIWAPKDLWLEELARTGLANAFTALVFSSDSRSMKPSRTLFVEALHGCGVDGPGPHLDIVCIGDSLRCDVAGAQAVGLRTIWINPTGRPLPLGSPKPDAWVADLRDLVPSGSIGAPGASIECVANETEESQKRR